MYALSSTQVAQASNYLKGAVDVTLRSRPLLGMLDANGRIDRNYQGKDWNWNLEYRALESQPYTPFQEFDFYDTNMWLPVAVQPVFWSVPSALDITQRWMNSGQSQIVDQFNTRMPQMARGMQIGTAKALYNDVNSTSSGQGKDYMTGLMTFAHKSKAQYSGTSYADRLAPPDETVLYGGLSIGLGSQGGSWSNTGPTPHLCTLINSDWPDGTSGDDQRYDVTSPRLYNYNTNQWNTPGAAPAAGTWRTNCLFMLSRANTDLGQISVPSMIPNVHMCGSDMKQAVMDQIRTAFRYTMQPSGQAANLGYPEGLEYEQGVLVQDASCPAGYVFSLNYMALTAAFYGADQVQEKSPEGQEMAGEQMVTGGIYVMLGPTRDPRGGAYLFLMIAGGQMRWTPRWITIHGDWVNNG